MLALELIKVAIGIGLAIIFGRDYGVSLAAGLIAGLVGGTGIVSYYICSMLLITGSQMLAPGLKFDGDFSQYDVYRAMRLKALSVTIGLFIATVLSLVGWQGLGTPIAGAVAALTVLFRFGVHFYFWLLVAATAVFMWIGMWLNIPNAPLVLLILIRSFGAVPELTMADRARPCAFNPENTTGDIGTVTLGIGIGLVPAVSAGLYTVNSQDVWAASAVGEGVALGLSLLIRTGGRTPISQTLQEFAPSINPIYALLAVGLTIWFSLLPGSVKLSCAPANLPTWLSAVTIVLALTYYGGIPGQPALSFAIGCGLLGLCQLIKQLPRIMPPKFQLGLSCLPTLML